MGDFVSSPIGIWCSLNMAGPHLNEYCIMRDFNYGRKEPKDCKNPCASVGINCSSRDRFGDSKLQCSWKLVGMGMHGMASWRNKGDGHC